MKFLTLINGIPRLQNEASAVAIYDTSLTVVASSPGSNQILGPVTTGTNITLPNSGSYTDQELEVYLNGQVLDDVLDFNFVGIAPRTQVSFTFDLSVGDIIRFRKIRN